MATVSDLANVAAATGAGYTILTTTRVANGFTEKVATFRKKLTGETGTTGAYQFEVVGVDASSMTTAKTNALNSLNNVRRHKYAGAPGLSSGATTTVWPDGNATTPVVDTN